MIYNKRRIQLDISLYNDRLEEVKKEHGEDFYAMDLKIKLMMLECLNEIAGKKNEY